MVSFPASMQLDANFKITFGSFGWPPLEDGENVKIAPQVTFNEVERASAPSSRPPLPRYTRRYSDGSDLINLTEHQGEILAEAFAHAETAIQQLALLRDDDGFTTVRCR